MSKIAILITSQLRFENELTFNLFLDKIKKYDIYISTYLIYEKIAKKITDNIIYLDNNPDYKTTYQSNMYQWLHLQYLIRTYKEKLSNYNILYRIRTDTNIPKKIFNQEVNISTIYCVRDLLFFGHKTHFIRLFENFFDEILNVYSGVPHRYLNINYNNFIKIKNPRFYWKWITFPSFVYNERFSIIKYNIINNIEKLNYINNNINNNISNNINCEFISRMPNNLQKNLYFASERIFPLHCINNGFIEGIKIKRKIILHKDRKLFNYIG